MKKVDEFYIFDAIHERFVPAWYELSFRKKLTEGDIRCDAPVFVLRIYRKIIDTLFKKTAELARLDVWMPLRSTFLFERVPRRKDEGMFHEIVIPLPQVVFETNNSCLTCGGGGKDTDIGAMCRMCDGTGHVLEYRWDDARILCHRLEILLSALRHIDCCVSGTAPQLFTVKIFFGQGRPLGSWMLGGDVTPAFAGWLSSLPVRENIKEATTAMIVAYNYIVGAHMKEDDSGFRTWAEKNGGFYIQCPGNACNIYPSRVRADFQSLAAGNYEGYEWECHNVDSPLQQLTLLAGLAALHDLARKAAHDD